MDEKRYNTINFNSDYSQSLSDFLVFDEKHDKLFEEYVDDAVTNINVER